MSRAEPVPNAPSPFATPGAAGWDPRRWLQVIGPGAIIASLTIGAGELIFSSRAGVLFGSRVLWLFLSVLVLKWALVFAAGRHMILTGSHPFARWGELPGARGWLPATFLLLAIACFPIWIAFHAGTLGTLAAWLTGTGATARGAGHLLWGLLFLGGAIALSLRGGYAALERIQLTLVLLMLAAVCVSALLLNPDWLALVRGLLVPSSLEYPAWLDATPAYAGIAARPVWIEAVTYVGVIGGSSYDYLAYVSYLRDKGWAPGRSRVELPGAGAASSAAPQLRKMAIDCAFSFAAVLVFSAVFVVCGEMVLGPRRLVPEGTNLLALQAEFVTPSFPALKPLYFFGAFMTMAGTLYGTIEVAPAVFKEWILARRGLSADAQQSTLDEPKARRIALLWAGGGAWIVLMALIIDRWLRQSGNPPTLIAVLTPANLFTGVLGCGIICALNLWADQRFLPAALRMPVWLAFLNVIGAISMTAIGLKAYWDHSGLKSWLLLLGTVLAGIAVAAWMARRQD